MKRIWEKLDRLEDNKIKLLTFIILPWPIFLLIIIVFFTRKFINNGIKRSKVSSKKLKKKFKIPKYKISSKEEKWFIEFDCHPDKFELTLSGKDRIIYYWSVSNTEVEEIGATPELEFLEKELRKIFGEVIPQNSEEPVASKPR